MAKIVTINVEYALALKYEQQCEIQQFQRGITLKEAIPFFRLDRQAKMKIETPVYGVFNQIVNDDYELQDGDRIEVYRPLEIDPKQARKIRAQRNPTGIRSTQVTELK